MKNTEFHTHDVKRCCESKLGIRFRDGAEYNGWYRLQDKKVARITIPKGRKPVPPKTYKSMATQLKLSVSQFDELLDCPLTAEGYRTLIEKSK